MIKQASQLKVGDVIYVAKYDVTAVVKKVTKHPHYLSSGQFWAVDFNEKVHCKRDFLGMSFNWESFADRDLIPVIGQSIN